MKKVIRLTESDLTRIVKRIINEQKEITCSCPELADFLKVIDGIKKDSKGYTPKVMGTFNVEGNQITLTADPVFIAPVAKDHGIDTSLTLTVTK